MTFGGPDNPYPWEAQRIDLCERFHWTLEYVDSLDIATLRQINEIAAAKHAVAHPGDNNG